jgi:hypothetical protein
LNGLFRPVPDIQILDHLNTDYLNRNTIKATILPAPSIVIRIPVPNLNDRSISSTVIKQRKTIQMICLFLEWSCYSITGNEKVQ